MCVKKNITEVYNYVNHSLTFIEAKNGALLALSSGLVIGILALWEQFSEEYFLWYFIAFVPALMALAFSLASFYPRLKNEKKEGGNLEQGEINVFRCESISRMPYAQFRDLLSEGIEVSFMDEQQLKYIHNTAIAAARKYRLFRCGFRSFSIYLPYTLILLAIYFIF